MTAKILKDTLYAGGATSGGGGTSLPDQTGHTGYLQTDGTDASWSDKPAIENIAPFINERHNICASATTFQKDGWSMTAFGIGAYVANGSTSYGSNASATYDGVAIGAQAVSSGGIAIGSKARASQHSIMIGNFSGLTQQLTDCMLLGTFHDSGELEGVKNKGFYWGTGIWDTNRQKWLTYKLFDGDTGLIPSERLAVGGTTGQVLSKTDTGMKWVDAVGGGAQVIIRRY